MYVCMIKVNDCSYSMFLLIRLHFYSTKEVLKVYMLVDYRGGYEWYLTLYVYILGM